MIFRDVELNALWSSITITDTHDNEIIHYPGTDTNEDNPLGQKETVITCTLIAQGEAQRRLILGLMKTRTRGNLVTGSTFYKQVTPGGVVGRRKIAEATWHIDVTFIALDPQEYDVATGEVAY